MSTIAEVELVLVGSKFCDDGRQLDLCRSGLMEVFHLPENLTKVYLRLTSKRAPKDQIRLEVKKPDCNCCVAYVDCRNNQGYGIYYYVWKKWKALSKLKNYIGKTIYAEIWYEEPVK